jgi:hypothetical protein
LLVIAFLLLEVALPHLPPPVLQSVLPSGHVSLLSIPYALLLARILPELYDPNVLKQNENIEVPGQDIPSPMPMPTLHPAFATGLLTVSVTTLVLFFASGLYTEKIGYANRYVMSFTSDRIQFKEKYT